MRRQARSFAITEYLRGRRTGVTTSQIAQRFGVTVRTAYRDLDALRDAELPLRADRGRGGCYALDRNYTLPPVNFTAREAALLVTLGRWATEMRLLPFAETLGRALDKVRGALSGGAQRELLELVKGLSFVSVPALPIDERVRKAIEQAWFDQQPLEIRYRGANGLVSTRIVRLTSVVMGRSLTMLNARDLQINEDRQFRLDRVEHAKAVS